MITKKNCFVTEKEENDYYSPMERKQRFFTSRWQAKHLWNQPSSKLKKEQLNNGCYAKKKTLILKL